MVDVVGVVPGNSSPSNPPNNRAHSAPNNSADETPKELVPPQYSWNESDLSQPEVYESMDYVSHSNDDDNSGSESPEIPTPTPPQTGDWRTFLFVNAPPLQMDDHQQPNHQGRRSTNVEIDWEPKGNIISILFVNP